MIVPVGTKVLSKSVIAGTHHAYPEGTLAVIVETPQDASHAYRVRLSDGFETSLTRAQFVLLRTHQEEGLREGMGALEDHELTTSVIYRCLVGSRAYGLDTETSDYDTRGIYLPPAERHWSLYGVPEQLENRETDEVYWELQKFLLLALKANPNILEVLHSPEVLDVTPLAEELLAMRTRFLSKLVYQTYNGYVMSQFKKLTSRRERGLEPKWKHAMHLIRLLLAGITALEEHVVPVRVDEAHRSKLMSIRVGEMPFEYVDKWRLELHRRFENAFRSTTLPQRPDYEAAGDFLIRARRFAAEVGDETAE
ncbi:MAG: nucleotidyltransferase domain-containing protein [Planctomycetes bacterium]|nr:nucleotidyltransferase domain-containing protein [Planctomycetota bacterium]MCB9891010.1 nucleotidyltransferase domain-containing protein [Planctomycetota bacterium]MCB9919137.1 nucleotidyltransferase domain-containing protein [Planctomycetota bacterium]